MCRKILPAFLILLGLVFLQATNTSFGDVAGDVNAVISKVSASNDPNAAAAICKAADEFYKNNKFEQARYLFQYLVDKNGCEKLANCSKFAYFVQIKQKPQIMYYF